MSTQVNLGGYNLKEISLIMLIVMVGFTTAIVAVGLVIAISNGSDITFTGTFDLGQYQAVVIGIAFVATVLVAQQLTAKNQAKAVSDTDSVWLAEELAKYKNKKDTPD